MNLYEDLFTMYCDRCGQPINALVNKQLSTRDFYYVKDNYWSRYALPHEKILCRSCVESNKQYKLDNTK